MRRLPYLLVTLLVACAQSQGHGEAAADEIEVSEDDDGKADADSELRVRTGETTLWMTKDIARRETPDGPLFVLRGRTSRNLTHGTGFVFDDPYGDFAQRTPRTFEVTWPVSTARSLVDGVNQFVRLGFVPSAGRPDTLTTRVVARPRLGAFTGSSAIYVTAELTPVVYGGTVVYRAKGSTTSPMSAIAATANGLSLTDLRLVDPTHFQIDLAPDVAFAIAGTTDGLAITAQLASGASVTKQARLGIAIKKLGLTAGDAYDRWPRPECTQTTTSCLQSLPDGSLDLAACGEAIVVLSCAGQVGVFADDVAVQAAIADGATRTSAPAFLTDATGLVGSARKDAFAGGAQQTVEDRVQQLYGRWYLTATSRDATLTAAVDRAIVDAYARPLELVEPVEPVPGNLAVTRHVAADALLAALATYDFEHSEYARPYHQIVAQFRAQHVAGIRQFRETLPLEPHYANPAHDLFVGNWLDPYVEVSIVRATGAAAGVFIEID